jgi:hypothetical protein
MRYLKIFLDSDIIIFLVSSSFISSDYCYGIEMKKALELHNSGNSIVVPLIIRPCDWTSAEFGSIQGLPKDAILFQNGIMKMMRG